MELTFWGGLGVGTKQQRKKEVDVVYIVRS